MQKMDSIQVVQKLTEMRRKRSIQKSVHIGRGAPFLLVPASVTSTDSHLRRLLAVCFLQLRSPTNTTTTIRQACVSNKFLRDLNFLRRKRRTDSCGDASDGELATNGTGHSRPVPTRPQQQHLKRAVN